jgi:hypothetical protein
VQEILRGDAGRDTQGQPGLLAGRTAGAAGSSAGRLLVLGNHAQFWFFYISIKITVWMSIISVMLAWALVTGLLSCLCNRRAQKTVRAQRAQARKEIAANAKARRESKKHPRELEAAKAKAEAPGRATGCRAPTGMISGLLDRNS